MDVLLAAGVYSFQDAAVFAQGIVDIAHQVVAAAVLPVVVAGPAFVGAEFLICAAPNNFLAFQACPLFHRYVV